MKEIMQYDIKYQNGFSLEYTSDINTAHDWYMNGIDIRLWRIYPDGEAHLEDEWNHDEFKNKFKNKNKLIP